MTTNGLAFGLPPLFDSPTQAVLQAANELSELDDFFCREVGTRVLAMSATAIAVIEALGHVMLGVGATAVATVKTPVCLVLTGGFVVSWAFMGWVANTLLSKSFIRWVQFAALQVVLLGKNPSRWTAQWSQWKDLFKTMGNFANGLALHSYRLSAFVDRWAGMDHAQRHINRAGKLMLFSATSCTLAWLKPHKVISNFNKVIPWPKSLDEHIIQWVKDYKGLIGVVATVAGAAVLHQTMSGKEFRDEWISLTATQVQTLTSRSITVGSHVVPWVADQTIGNLWRMWRGPIAAIAGAISALPELVSVLREHNEILRTQQLNSSNFTDMCPNPLFDGLT